MRRRTYTQLLAIVVTLGWLALAWRADAVNTIYASPLAQGTSTVTPTRIPTRTPVVLRTATRSPSPTVARATPTPRVTVASQPPVLTLRLLDSEQHPTGGFALRLDGLPDAPEGSHFVLWMLGEGDELVNLGRVEEPNNGQEFRDEADHPLLEKYSGAIVSLETDNSTLTPSQVIYSGTLPLPLVTPLRELFFLQQFAGTGPMLNARNEAEIVRVHSAKLVEQLENDNVIEARRHAEEVLNVLEGALGQRQGDLNRDGVSHNPGDGYGLLVYLADIEREILALEEVVPEPTVFAARLAEILAIGADAEVLAATVADQAFVLIGVNASPEGLRAAADFYDTAQNTEIWVNDLYEAVLELAEIELVMVGTVPTDIGGSPSPVARNDVEEDDPEGDEAETVTVAATSTPTVEAAKPDNGEASESAVAPRIAITQSEGSGTTSSPPPNSGSAANSEDAEDEAEVDEDNQSSAGTTPPLPPVDDDDASAEDDEELPMIRLEEDIPTIRLGPQPDLAIERMVITPDMDECGDDADLGLEVVVINRGEAVAGEFIIEINTRRLRVEAGLEPEATVRIWLPSYGDTNSVVLDTGETVDEMREDNNSMTIGRDATLIPACEPLPTDTPTVTPTPTPTLTPTPTEVATNTPTPTPIPPPTVTPTPTQAAAALPPVRGNVPLQIVFVRGDIGRTDIYIYDMASGETRAIANNSSCDEAEPRWSPGGDAILYHANCAGSYDIYWTHVASGETRRLTQTDDYDEWEPNLTADGAWLVYRRTPASSTRHTNNAPLWLHNMNTGEVLDMGITGRTPIWSPDGRRMVYMSNESGVWQIYVYDANTGDVELVSRNCPRQCRWPTWLPDSQHIAYSSSTDEFVATGIWVAPLGGEPSQWLSGPIGRASWSESGQVTFLSNAGIEIADDNGSNRRVLIPDSTNWAPFWNR